ncbi:MAG: double-strand break repair protein AddB [Hyphomicrobiaceae bacterium]
MTLGSEETAQANIFTIPPGRPFLPALAQAILNGDLPRHGGSKPDRLELPAWTILMPTRRAARTLQDAFVDAAGGGALLLPAIRAISEGEEDLGLIESVLRAPDASTDDLELPPAIGPLERVLLLTQLVQAWSQALRQARPDEDEDTTAGRPYAAAGAATPAQAARLASELARLIDMLETENVAIGRLAELVPDAYASHWQQTLDFLKIITEFWPGHLRERNQLSPADRRNRLILAEAQRLAANPPEAPIIVAGVTGSVPATAELMRAVAALPNGAIVLPGLDPHLDRDAYAALAGGHPEHPQFGLAKLIGALGATRDDVKTLPGAELGSDLTARNRLIAEAMRPPGTMAGWRRLIEAPSKADFSAALANVSLIETPNDDAEAEVVALALREAAETPGLVAALVSPDRLLARRVGARLEAWGIRVDDSAGRPFAKTVPGAFLELVANAHRSGFAPAHLMALLKHPLTRLGLEPGEVRRRAQPRDCGVPTILPAWAADGGARSTGPVQKHSQESRGRVVRLLKDSDWDAIDDLWQRLAQAFAPLHSITAGNQPQPFGKLVAGHVATAEALAQTRSPDEESANATEAGADAATSALWARDEGEAASLLMARLMADETPQPQIAPSEFPEMLRTLVGSENIRTRVPAHPRLYIWGPYEARLHQPDVVILSGLNEGIWPGRPIPSLVQPWHAFEPRAALAGRRNWARGSRSHTAARHAARDHDPGKQVRRRANGRLALAAAVQSLAGGAGAYRGTGRR